MRRGARPLGRVFGRIPDHVGPVVPPADLVGRQKPRAAAVVLALDEQIRPSVAVYRLLCGEPGAEQLEGVFWRHKRLPEPMDIAQAGVLWFSPVVPMRGADALEMVAAAEPIFARHGFEPLITLSAVTTRALVGVISVCYDPADESQVTAAAECYGALSHTLRDQGFYPYRSGLQSEVRARESP